MTEPVILWRDPFTINTGATSGTQLLASSAGLRNGRIVVSWTDLSNNVETALGSDIIARYLDPLGEMTGNPFRLNSTGTVGQETDGELVTRHNNGFALVYEQNSNSGDTDILVDIFSDTGVNIAGGVVAAGAAGGAQVRNPTFAENIRGTAANDILIIYDTTELGNTDIGQVSLRENNTLVSQPADAQNSADFDRRPDAAESGGIVIAAYEEGDGANTSIEFYRSSALGLSFFNDGPQQIASQGEDPQVASLGTGTLGFVIAWTQPGGGIEAQLRDTNGDLLRSTFTIAGGSGDNEHSSDVVGLRGDGFFAVWYDSNDDRIEGRRFDSNGDPVGLQLTIEEGTGLLRPEVSLLSDGRVFVTWEDGGDIRGAIVDPRDDELNGDVNFIDDFITSRPGGTVLINGLDGNDFIYGQAGIDTIFGGPGNDVISTGLGSDTARGGTGNDRMHLWESNPGDLDFLDGDFGTDSVDFQQFEAAVWVNLTYSGPEAWTQDDADATDTIGTWRTIADLLSIENLTGSAFADFLVGDAGDNLLSGVDGDDDMRGRLGSDTLFGGRGHDLFRLYESVAGDMDTVEGADGDDTVDASGAGFGVWMNLAFNGPRAWTQDDLDATDASGTWRAFANIANVENLRGSIHSDSLTGNAAANRFIYSTNGAGTGGLDAVNGLGGEDAMDFSETDFGVWVSLGFSGTEAWTQDDADATDTSGTWREIATLAGIENLIGSAFSDRLIGDSGNNRLSYTAENAGAGGLDIFAGNGGRDAADFSKTAFGVWVNLGASGTEAWTQDDTDATDASGTWREIALVDGVEDIFASSFSDALTGDGGANTIFFTTNDVGVGGVDAYDGQGGIDTADFSFADYAVWVNLSFGGQEVWTQDDESVYDFSGNWRPIATLEDIENVVGTAFADWLTGDDGDNELTGGGGPDRFRFLPNYGDDTITDFTDIGGSEDDLIDFSGHSGVNGFADIDDVQIVDGNTVITAGGGTITVLGVDSGLGLGDFVF